MKTIFYTTLFALTFLLIGCGDDVTSTNNETDSSSNAGTPTQQESSTADQSSDSQSSNTQQDHPSSANTDTEECFEEDYLLAVYCPNDMNCYSTSARIDGDYSYTCICDNGEASFNRSMGPKNCAPNSATEPTTCLSKSDLKPLCESKNMCSPVTEIEIVGKWTINCGCDNDEGFRWERDPDEHTPACKTDTDGSTPGNDDGNDDGFDDDFDDGFDDEW